MSTNARTATRGEHVLTTRLIHDGILTEDALSYIEEKDLRAYYRTLELYQQSLGRPLQKDEVELLIWHDGPKVLCKVEKDFLFQPIGLILPTRELCDMLARGRENPQVVKLMTEETSVTRCGAFFLRNHGSKEDPHHWHGVSGTLITVVNQDTSTGNKWRVMPDARSWAGRAALARSRRTHDSGVEFVYGHARCDIECFMGVPEDFLHRTSLVYPTPARLLHERESELRAGNR